MELNETKRLEIYLLLTQPRDPRAPVALSAIFCLNSKWDMVSLLVSLELYIKPTPASPILTWPPCDKNGVGLYNRVPEVIVRGLFYIKSGTFQSCTVQPIMLLKF